MGKINSIAEELKERIKQNNNQKSETNSKIEADNQGLKELLNTVLKIQNENLALKTLLKRNEEANNETLSTTQFFNPSLAENMYNMTGNPLQVNSYLAIRQMLGIVNNSTPGVKQGIEGLNINNNGTTANGVSSGVGLTENKQIQGWWLWIMILERIDYFANLVTWKCENKSLLKALRSYMFDTILSGRACIVKEGDNFKTYSVFDIKLNTDGEVESFNYFNSNFVLNATYTQLENNEGLFESTKNNINDYVLGQWKKNGYNIWFYVMSYLLNAVDLWYIFWNRARLNKTIVLQKKGNSSTSSIEAYNFLNPYQNLVTINSVSILDNEEGVDNAKLEFENRYEILNLGNGEETQYSYTNFILWINYWDNTIGIRSNPLNSNTQRSISNEIEPQILKLSHLQQDFINQIDNLVEEIKQKWNIEVDFTFNDDIFIEQIAQNGGNPSFKAEQGNETENNKNNGENQ